jgi:hypothetical protein
MRVSNVFDGACLVGCAAENPPAIGNSAALQQICRSLARPSSTDGEHNKENLRNAHGNPISMMQVSQIGLSDR